MKDEDDDVDEETKIEPKRGDSDDDEDDEKPGGDVKSKEGEEVQVRDVQYKLEKLVSFGMMSTSHGNWVPNACNIL